MIWHYEKIGRLTHLYSIEVPACILRIESRPHYDRGNWIARVEPTPGTPLARDFDYQDGWPRYFFDLERAKLECEAWLAKRNLLP